MAEYIEREAFKQKHLCCGYLPEMSEDEFDKFPTADVVEVVHCHDCQFCGKYLSGGLYCKNEDGLLGTTPDAFCSLGVRKNGGNET